MKILNLNHSTTLQDVNSAKEIIKGWKTTKNKKDDMEYTIVPISNDFNIFPAFKGAVLKDEKDLDNLKQMSKEETLKNLEKRYFKICSEIINLENELASQKEMFSISEDYLKSNQNYLLYRSLLPLEKDDKTAFKEYVIYCMNYIDTKRNDRNEISKEIELMKQPLPKSKDIFKKPKKENPKRNEKNEIDYNLPTEWKNKDVMDNFSGQIEF